MIFFKIVIKKSQRMKTVIAILIGNKGEPMIAGRHTAVKFDSDPGLGETAATLFFPGTDRKIKIDFHCSPRENPLRQRQLCLMSLARECDSVMNCADMGEWLEHYGYDKDDENVAKYEKISRNLVALDYALMGETGKWIDSVLDDADKTWGWEILKSADESSYLAVYEYTSTHMGELTFLLNADSKKGKTALADILDGNMRKALLDNDDLRTNFRIIEYRKKLDDIIAEGCEIMRSDLDEETSPSPSLS